MAFSVPTPVASKGVRRYVSVSRTDDQKTKEKFKPSTDLFCLKCIKNGLITEAYGFCKVCMDFLCSKCVDKHESTLLTLNHGLITGHEMMERYHHAMRKDKKEGRSRSRNYLDMVADGRASFQYEETPQKFLPSKERHTTDSPIEENSVKDAGLVRKPRIRLGSDVMTCFICACVIYADGKLILADANNKNLKFFNKHFKNLFVFHMDKEPWDMCKAVNIDEDLYVTESRVQGIHQFRVGTDIKYVFTLKVDGECFGITAWKGGVAVSVRKNRKFQIKLLDKFGNTHRNIEDMFQGQLKLSSPWYLASIKKGQHILISDARAGTVSSIDVDSGLDFICKDRKELRDPRNITSDDKDNIYVVEYESDTIHQLTPTGQDQGVILCENDGLDNPCGLAYNDGKLLLQAKMDSNFVQIYELQ